MAGNTIRIKAILDDKVSGGLAKIRDKFDTLGKSKGFQSLVMGVGVGAGAAAFAVAGEAISKFVDFAQEGVKKASDLNETLSKSGVIFGTSAKSVEIFGKNAAKAFGLSQQAAVEAAATFGNFFVGIGEGQASAAKMSTRLVALAGDLASFNNLDPTEVLDKLRSGLAGEAEPLRRLGVFLNEAKVKAKATEMGLAGAHGELTEGAKILARYQLILDETGTAQGDFARTADGAANSQRTLNAQLENSQTTLGQKFLPVAKQVTDWQIDFLEGLGKVSTTIDLSFSTPVERATKIAILMAESERAMAADGREAARIMAVLGGATQTTADDSKELEDQLKDTGRAARLSLPDILDAVYGPAIMRGNEAGLVRDIREVKKEIKEARKAGDNLRVTELKGQLASLQKDLKETRVQQLILGQKPVSKGMINWLDTLMTKTAALGNGYVTAAAAAANLAQAPKTHKSGKAVGHRAEGGWVGLHGPELSWVGEKGPEYIIPNKDLGKSSPMGVIHTHVYLNGREIALAVDRENYARLQRAAPTASRT